MTLIFDFLTDYNYKFEFKDNNAILNSDLIGKIARKDKKK
jgi:hypothetical protein